MNLENDMKDEMKKTEAIVHGILAIDDRARNDDKWLTFKVMRCFTSIYIPYEDFCKIPSFETVARARRKIQNDKGMFPPNWETAIKRGVKEDVMRKWARNQEVL